MKEKKIKSMLAAAAAMFAGLIAFADETISANTQLNADMTVSGTLYLADGATLDLNGHNLVVNALAATADDDVPGYRFLDYIQSSGHQWLYSGYTPNYTDKVVMKLKFLALASGSSWLALFCSRGASTSMPFLCAVQGSSTIRFDHRVSGTNINRSYSFASGFDYTIMMDGQSGSCAVNETTNTWTQTDEAASWAATGPFAILGAHAYGADLANYKGTDLSLQPSCRLYSFQVYDENGALQCDMVPAIRTSDDAIGMYDRARSTFIENYGTEAFVAGPRAAVATITNASAQVSELRVNVPENVVSTNGNVAVSGNVRLVKEGAGSYFVALKGQSYTAGTDIDAGTVAVDDCGTKVLFGSTGGNVVRNGDFEAEGTAVPKTSNKDWSYANATGFNCPEWTMSNPKYMGLSGPKTGIWISNQTQINDLMGTYGFFMKTTGTDGKGRSGDLSLSQGGLALSRGWYRISYNYTTRADSNHAPAKHVVNLIHGNVTNTIGEATAEYSERTQYKSAEWLVEIDEEDEGEYTLQFLQTIADNGSAERTTILDNIVVEKVATEVVVNSGATVELASGARDFTDVSFVLNGGTLVNNSGAGSNPLLGNVRLTANSVLSTPTVGGFVGRDDAATVIDLGGYTLDVQMETSKAFYLRNTTISNGTLVLPQHMRTRVEGTDGVSATNATIEYSCLWTWDATLKAGNVVAHRTTSHANASRFLVYGTLTPVAADAVGESFDKVVCTMMDGSVLDLSRAGAGLPAESAGLLFEDNATVAIRLGGNNVGNPLVSWTTAPTNLDTLTFVKAAGESGYSLKVKDNGLYAVRGLTIIVK